MNGARIREAGDAALVAELDERIDPAVNDRAITVAARVRSASLGGVRDVVPTYRSVAVYFDPLKSDVTAIRTAIEGALAAPVQAVHGRRVEIPVVYGGPDGPDLAEVAAWARMSEDEVVARHLERDYRVFMLGFLPGFAYLGSVDERIAIPRRATPRLKVARGAVGIAGRQTGVYPRESPGGWQIIGRTSASLFDSAREPAALLRAGDSVRFARAARADLTEGGPSAGLFPVSPTGAWARSATVIRPGLMTTVQDRGRWGHQASGVPVGGALDPLSHRMANAMVGNSPDAATLEVTIAGPELRLDHDVVLAIAGADLQATVDGTDVPTDTPLSCRAGSVIRFGQRRAGARAYLAFDGGIQVPPVLGSRSTHVAAALGGVNGRPLRAGDRLPIGPRVGSPRPARTPSASHVRGAGARLRVLPGPQSDDFPASAMDLLEGTRFEVTPRADRMGFRLAGGAISRRAGREMISDAAFTGAIQVPPSGEPILLMHDRQTTGGYPQMAVVITADLPRAGQLAPGDWVEFERCTMADAMAALGEQEAMLRGI